MLEKISRVIRLDRSRDLENQIDMLLKDLDMQTRHLVTRNPDKEFIEVTIKVLTEEEWLNHGRTKRRSNQ